MRANKYDDDGEGVVARMQGAIWPGRGWRDWVPAVTFTATHWSSNFQPPHGLTQPSPSS